MRMTSLLKVMLITSLLFIVFFLGCEEEKNPTTVIEGIQMEAPESGKLNAFPILGYMQNSAYRAPKIDGSASEMIWDAAEQYEIQLAADENGNAPNVKLRALYDNWYIYILAEWDDASKDMEPGFWWYGNPDPNGTTDIAINDTIYTVWVTEDSTFMPQRRPVKVATGPESWRRWHTPFDAVTKKTTHQFEVHVSVDSVFSTVWDSVFVTYDTLHISGGEDGLALMWNVNVGNFLNCANLCHDNSHMSTDTDEAADVWFWSSYRTNLKGVSDDLALTGTGFVGDEGDSCFVNNIDTENDLPDFAFIDHPSRNSMVLYDTSSVKYYGSLAWFSGHYIPGYSLYDPTESRADVEAVGSYDTDGKWILEIKRRIHTDDIQMTTDNTDIQFNPESEADVSFHLVVYNNAGGKNHAKTSNVEILHFVQLMK